VSLRRKLVRLVRASSSPSTTTAPSPFALPSVAPLSSSAATSPSSISSDIGPLFRDGDLAALKDRVVHCQRQLDRIFVLKLHVPVEEGKFEVVARGVEGMMAAAGNQMFTNKRKAEMIGWCSAMQ
jgi:hypothetical protein